MRAMSEVESPARRKWRELVVRQRGSGLSVAAFCRRNGVAVSSLFAWKRRLSDAAAVPAFVEATIADAAADAAVADGSGGGDASGRAAGVTIELTGGRRILLARGFDRRALLDAIDVLDGKAAAVAS